MITLSELSGRERRALLAIYRGNGSAPTGLSVSNEDVARRLAARGLIAITDDIDLPVGLVWCTITAAGESVVGDALSLDSSATLSDMPAVRL